MSDRKQANLERMNELWHLHDPEDGPGKGRCLAFVLDRRYLDSDDGTELRLGVSFGDNVVAKETKQGFLPVPAQEGKLVFGVHLVGVQGGKVTLYDRWLDAVEAGDVTAAAEAEQRAEAILAGMTDEKYLTLVSDSKSDERALKVSDASGLGEFEVVEAEAF